MEQFHFLSPDRAGLIALSWNVDTKLKPISGFLLHGRKLHLPDQIYFSPLASINEAPSGEHLNGSAQIEFRCNNVAIEMVRNGKWPFGNQTSRKLDFHQQPNWLCASWKQFELVGAPVL